MKTNRSLLLSSVLALLVAAPAVAQQAEGAGSVGATGSSSDPATERGAVNTQPSAAIQYYSPGDQRGINKFEAPKQAGAPYAGFRLDWTAAFAQQFQNIAHSNTADPSFPNNATVNANQLADIGWGFNLAAANLGLNAQLAPGIRVALESYMSSRHHNEFWVKGGYLQIDESPIDHPALHRLMDFVTVKAGMFGLNYGDAHFRRTDNGMSLHNPFVENYILDAFNTEIGAEVYFRTGPWLAMIGVTDGVNKGGVTNPSQRSPAVLGKVGFDQEFASGVRARLTGSVYNVDKTPSTNLYFGDRAGSRYFNVLDNATGANHFNGRINPAFGNELTAVQINPFVKLGGLELFGVVERASGKATVETERRTWNQYAGDVVYRFLANDQMYVGGRYNTVSGKLRNMANEVSVDRAALAAGWFITPSILVKGEYVNQKYNDFPTMDIRHGGTFNGFVFEGAVAF